MTRAPTNSTRAALCLALVCAAFGSFTSATVARAAGAASLLARAEKNTNSVSTLIHTDFNVITTPTLIVQVHARGAEDEARNRERDVESVVVTARSGGKTKHTLRYSAEIIFMNGTVYYRTSYHAQKWISARGTRFVDPYTGGWQRARTMVTFPATAHFQPVGTSGGTSEFRASSFAAQGGTETASLWVSGGATPYVVREVVDYRASRGGGEEHQDTRLGPFNTRILILAPTKGGTT
ncbi:MAG TPA: hypothetical protein VKX16_11845 [Chloroflexota bacterium]|nr:hypothetical protein [Chloroflexota bacterium]